MTKRRWNLPGLASCLAVTVLVVNVGAVDAINSRWRTEDMKVDGAINEFAALTSIQQGVAATAANDGEVLHLVMTVSDPAVRQRLMVAGVIVYLDASNKKRETFGIRLPRLAGPPVPDEPPPSPKLTYLEVIGPGKDELHIVELNEASGLEAAVGSHEGSLVLELLVPLRVRSGWPHAPGVAIGQKVLGLGLVTRDPPTPRGRGGEGRGGRPGGGGGRGGGMPGGPMGRGGDEPGARGSMTGKALKAWTSVLLASAPVRD